MRIAALLVLCSVAAAPAPPRAQTLPVVLLPPTHTPTHTLALLITGDGGWAATDRAIGKRLAEEGTGVVVLNSLHYFRHPRAPALIAGDLSSLARLGCARWSCERIVLIGYSMGADVLPFVVDKLESDVRRRVRQLDLISLSHQASFRFFPTQWVGISLWPTVATLPQLAKVHGIDIVCIYGTSDPDAACRDLPPGQATSIPVPSGHVMSDVADQVAELAAAHVRDLARPTALGGRARPETITLSPGRRS